MQMCDVAIVGAGPYGLALAAHLRARGVDFRIFGRPMHTWLHEMPKGMHLKSEGFASFLYDPEASFTLAHFCKERGLPYADMGLPVPLETFSAYGLEFQKRFVPNLENKLVTSLSRSSSGFELQLEDGQLICARRVVLAIGITHYAYLPPMLSSLPEQFVTHSSRHHDLDRFKGRDVAVVGAGASALDIAALLHQLGASVQVIARKPAIRFHDRAQLPRPLLDRIHYPMTGIGPGWKLVLLAHAPHLFRLLPERTRLEAVRKILGPAPGWFIKEQVVGKVPFNLGVEIRDAKIENDRVNLLIADKNGAERTLSADHVIVATGYKVDLRRLAFLNPELLSKIRAVEKAPVLSANFESSVPGLFFIGVSAANTFGPLLRFAYGAGFTSPRLAKHLAKSASHNLVQVSKAELAEREEVCSSS